MRALPWLGSELTGGLPPCDHPRTSAHASGHAPGRVPFGHWASHPRGARNGPWGCSLPHLPHSLSRHGGRRQLAAPVPSMALLLRAWCRRPGEQDSDLRGGEGASALSPGGHAGCCPEPRLRGRPHVYCAQDGKERPDTPTFVQQCQRQGGQIVELKERGSE